MGFGETVIFTAGGSFDDDGDPIEGSGSVTAEGCIIDWGTSDDTAELGRNGMGIQATIFVEHPPVGGVPHTGTALIRGVAYEVIGRAALWQDPDEPGFGGLVVTVRRNEG
ncbi:hypothetical protein [Rhodococcus jostii]|uniref:hypothetical protein n=1 Tax=Rhodococcus jostii TaxID=132919 RepID=UPI0036340CF3